MYVELPKLTRCCFCLPLRRGLLFWSYTKIVWCLLLTYMILYNISNSLQPRADDILEWLIIIIVMSILLVEFTITLIFIIGAHKKNPKLLRVYYRYGLFTLVLLFLLYIFGVGMLVFEYFNWDMRYIYITNLYEVTFFGAGVLLLNLYVVSLIRSEAVKLENNAQFHFQNHVTEPSCYMEENESLDQNNIDSSNAVCPPAARCCTMLLHAFSTLRSLIE